MATAAGYGAGFGTGTIGGHPRGLAYLAFTELWERFSYYGMTALLALYMTKQLLLPGHAESVLGLGALRDLFEFRGPMSNLAFASLIYGWYGGLVYFTPIVGGWIADKFLGAKHTVVLGALLMSAGHLAMSFDQSFLIALGLLILGSGCLKGNIATQVGALYPVEAQSLRDRGFTIFSTGINIGAVIGPLATGGVAAVYGWHAGFALAAILMLLALGVYLAGQRHFPAGRTPGTARVEHPPLSTGERRRVWSLLGVIALSIPAAAAYSIIWGIGIIWVDSHVALGWVPSSWFTAVDSFGSILAAPVLVALWAWQARRHREPGSLAKIGIGLAIIGLSALLLAAGNLYAATPDTVFIGWALAGYLGMGAGFMYYWPITLALIAKSAPPKVKATMMGAAYLSSFFGNTAGGWVGSYYDQMSPAAFWTLDATIALAGAALVFVVRKPLARALEPAP